MKTSFQGLWLAFYCINAPFGQSGSHCNTSISVLNLIIRLCIVYTLLDELLENIFPPKLSSPKGIQWFMSGAVYLLVRVAMTWSAMKIWKYNAFKEFLKVTSITAAKWFSSLCVCVVASSKSYVGGPFLVKVLGWILFLRLSKTRMVVLTILTSIIVQKEIRILFFLFGPFW